VSSTLESLGLRLRPRPPYLALFAAAIQRGLTYRATRLLSMLTSGIVVAIQYVVWKGVFAARAEVGAFSWHEMQTYIALVFLINALLPADHELALYTRIRDGMVAVDLARPLDFQWSQLASASGAAVVELAFRGGALVLAAALLLDFSLPPSAANGTLFAASLVLGFLARFLIAYMVALSCFWLLNVMGLQWMRAAVTNVLSGAVVPITLFPGVLRDLAQFSPFAGMTFVPSSIYVGHLPGGAAAQAIAVQMFWIALLWSAARRMWHLCTRKLIVQGG
jgi:ABC-2 type transport system permease protein